MKIYKILTQVAANKVFLYIFSRYITYVIQFINSIFIAIYLGPLLLGVWGFITLIINYFSQINLGIPHSLNALASINKDKKTYLEALFNASITIMTLLMLFILCIFLSNQYFGLEIGVNYGFRKYILYVCLIIIANYYISLFSAIFRIKNQIFEIAFSQSIFPLLTMLAIFLKRGEDLLFYLVIANLISFMLSLVLFLLRCPIRLRFMLPKSLVTVIWRKGLALFLYNSSFYLIMISTRTLISSSYSVEEFGYFTFSLTMANTFLLLLESISFLIYPKVINRLSFSDNQKALEILERLRHNYVICSHFLMYLVIIAFPFFIFLFPEYSDVKGAFILIALTFVLYTNCFGYSGLLIAKGKERVLGIISFSALIFNIISTYCLINIFKVDYHLAILGTMLSYTLYMFALYFCGRKLLGATNLNPSFFNDLFPLKLFIPFVFSLTLAFLEADAVFFLLPFVIFVVFNARSLVLIKDTITDILKKPEIINV